MSSPLVFNENIIFSDDTGSIFSIDRKGKINWKNNIYLANLYNLTDNLLSFLLNYFCQNNYFVAIKNK